MNNPNDKQQAFLLLFLPYSEPVYAADLKMPAHSYLRFCCLWHLFIWKRWCRYKAELPYPAHPAINRAFTESFPWFFRSRAQTYNSLCFQENTTVECEVSGLIFPVLVGNYKGQGHWSVAEEVGLTTFQNILIHYAIPVKDSFYSSKHGKSTNRTVCETHNFYSFNRNHFKNCLKEPKIVLWTPK